MSQATWDEYFIRMAFLVASKSKDTSTKVGAVIVGPDHEVRSTGYNGFPRKVKDDVLERLERPEKYLWVVHAEQNAIYNAARVGIATNGCTMYLNWEPCSICAGAIIQAGIIEIVRPSTPPTIGVAPTNRRDWEDDFKRAREKFIEAVVSCRTIPFTES